MKSQKILSLDTEIIEELKKINASKLINELLKDYFSQNRKIKKQELLNKLNNLQIEIKNKEESMKIIKERIREIEITNKRIKTIFKNIPIEIIEDFRRFPKMSKQILLNRFKEIYHKTYNIKFEEIEKAYKQYYKENAK